MNIKIGYIGVSNIKSKIEHVLKEFEQVEINYYFYQHESESVKLAELAEKENDVILFGGPVPKEIVTNQMELTKPNVTLSYDGSALYRGILLVANLTNKAHNKISIDTIPRHVISYLYDDLQLDKHQLFIHESDKAPSEEITKFHVELYNQKKTECAVTYLRSTYNLLSEKGIPTVLVTPPISTIRDGIQQSILLYQKEKFRKSQIAVGIIDIKLQETLLEDYSLQEKQLEIHHLLISYARKFDASLFKLDEFKFVFYTTLGILETIQPSLFDIFIEEIGRIIDSNVRIGFGVGESSYMASHRADIALHYGTKNNDKYSCYIVLDDESVINVLDEQLEEQHYRSNNPHLKELAQKNNISHMVLKRISDIVQKLGKTTFTSEELAVELGQTPRNVRRILKELVEKDLAVVTGEEHYAGKGRPKMVYEITFTNI